MEYAKPTNGSLKIYRLFIIMCLNERKRDELL